MRTASAGAKALRCLCAASLASAVVCSPNVASALAGELETRAAGDAAVQCGNGWAVNYSVLNSKICITGVASVGTGKLTLPETVEGMPVAVIGAGAFKDCTQLSAITLPSSVSVLQTEAFCGTGLTSVEIPAAVTALSYRCFKSCTKLAGVSFKGQSMLYLGQEAFMYCSALQSITLPALTSYPIVRDDADITDAPGTELFGDTCSIGKSCFAQCTSLKTMTFGGVVEHETPEYFLDISCFNGDNALETFIWTCKKDTVSGGTSANKQFTIANSYYTLDFYNSKADAAALKNRVASVTYKPQKAGDSYNMVKILSLINGTEDYSAYKLPGSTGSIPACPAGKVWGVADNGVIGDFSTLSDSFQVIAVDAADLEYGWVTTPEVYKYYAATEISGNQLTMNSTNLPVAYLEKDGSLPDFEKLTVHSADGSVLPASSYRLVIEKADMQRAGSGQNLQVAGWDVVSGIEGTGRYQVHAVSTVNGTQTPAIIFEVKDFEPAVHAYENYSQVDVLGAIDCDLAALLGGAAEYSVVVPSGSWAAQLVGAGLAGAGSGLMLYDAGTQVSSDAYRAHNLSGADSVQILGSTASIPQSVNVSNNTYLSDWLLGSITGDQTRYKDDATPQQLAAQVYATLSQGYWGAQWGSSAVVMSGSDAALALPVAQYLYQNRAPVFFADESGNLSASDLSALAAGGFQQVLIAGDETAVSAACEASVNSATGVTAQRVLATGASAHEASLEFAQYMLGQGNSLDYVAIADGTSCANVSLAAQAAALGRGIVLVCTTSQDVKKAQDYLYGILKAQGSSTVKELYVAGSFAEVDPNAVTRLKSIWATPLSTAAESSDTFQVGQCVYKPTGSSTATLVKVLDTAGGTVSVGAVENGGTSWKVTSVGANAFGANVTKVTLGSAVKSVNAAAFASCPNLKSLDMKASAVTKLAASQLAGLTKLSSLTLPAGLTTVGKSALKGCTALASISLGAKLSSIGASAFQGCSALKTITIKSTKLKAASVGAKAFTGTPAKATVKVPSAKMASYKTIFQKKGLSKKAVFKKA